MNAIVAKVKEEAFDEKLFNIKIKKGIKQDFDQIVFSDNKIGSHSACRVAFFNKETQEITMCDQTTFVVKTDDQLESLDNPEMVEMFQAFLEI